MIIGKKIMKLCIHVIVEKKRNGTSWFEGWNMIRASKPKQED